MLGEGSGRSPHIRDGAAANREPEKLRQEAGRGWTGINPSLFWNIVKALLCPGNRE